MDHESASEASPNFNYPGGTVTIQPDWQEPTLFSSVGLEYPALTIELVVHLEGPSNRCQCVVSVRDPRVTGYLSIQGHMAVDIGDAQHHAAQLIIESISEAMRHITPF